VSFALFHTCAFAPHRDLASARSSGKHHRAMRRRDDNVTRLNTSSASSHALLDLPSGMEWRAINKFRTRRKARPQAFLQTSSREEKIEKLLDKIAPPLRLAQ